MDVLYYFLIVILLYTIFVIGKLWWFKKTFKAFATKNKKGENNERDVT